jgi:excisionase family DNA binding protein
MSRSPLAHAVLDALAHDVEAAAEVARLLAPHLRPADVDRACVYTVASLAAATGIPMKTIRAAIRAGELSAARRGKRYVIGASAVESWASASPRGQHRRRSPSPARTRPRSGPLSRALSTLPDGR